MNTQSIVKRIAPLKLCLTFIALASLYTAPLYANGNGISDGNGISGGGDAVGDEFFDSYLTRKVFRPENHPSFKTIVEPILKKLDDTDPYFGDRMRSALTQKKWFVIDEKLPELPKAELGIVFDAKQAAYQTKQEIFLKSRFVKSAKGDLDIAALILHELAQGVRLALNENRKAEDKIPKESPARLTIDLLSTRADEKDELSYIGQSLVKNNFIKEYTPKAERENTQKEREAAWINQKSRIDQHLVEAKAQMKLACQGKENDIWNPKRKSVWLRDRSKRIDDYNQLETNFKRPPLSKKDLLVAETLEYFLKQFDDKDEEHPWAYNYRLFRLRNLFSPKVDKTILHSGKFSMDRNHGASGVLYSLHVLFDEDFSDFCQDFLESVEERKAPAPIGPSAPAETENESSSAN